MSSFESLRWTIETEGGDSKREPRSLWDRVESNLHRQEVFTIRRIIGESLIERSEDLWREVDALEEMLWEAQDQNRELSNRLAARPMIPLGRERTLLEAHLRLLLGKLGAAGNAGGCNRERGNEGPGEVSTARPHKANKVEEDEPLLLGKLGRSCWATGTCGRTQGISSAPPISRAVPLESEQDRTVYKYIISGGSQSDIFAKAHARGVEAPSESVHSQHQGESRPDSARRPYSSQSTRSAPEYLEPGRRGVSIETIDATLGELRTAFHEEAEGLLEKIAAITSMIEQEANQKVEAERQNRQCSPRNGDRGDRVNIASCELHRYGKKLEEALRSQEHATETAERLSLPYSSESTNRERFAAGRRGGDPWRQATKTEDKIPFVDTVGSRVPRARPPSCCLEFPVHSRCSQATLLPARPDRAAHSVRRHYGRRRASTHIMSERERFSRSNAQPAGSHEDRYQSAFQKGVEGDARVRVQSAGCTSSNEPRGADTEPLVLDRGEWMKLVGTQGDPGGNGKTVSLEGTTTTTTVTTRALRNRSLATTLRAKCRGTVCDAREPEAAS